MTGQDLGRRSTLVLGGGPRGGFNGEVAAVRLYRRTMDAAEVCGSASRRLS